MQVVPVLKEHWTKPAFDAHTEVVDGEERIYGRGAQDMKLVPIQYLVAISRLVASGAKPKRTVFLSFVPDEEVGGGGMAWFLRSAYYKENMDGKIGCAFDEGIASLEDTYTVFYGEVGSLLVHAQASVSSMLTAMVAENALVGCGSGQRPNRPWLPIHSGHGDACPPRLLHAGARIP